MKSQRQLKVGQLIKKYISEILLRDDLLSSSKVFITVMEADVSPDIKFAKIYLDIFGTDNTKNIVDKLNSMSGHFRHKLASLMTTRNIPEIVFVLDDTSKYASKIEGLIAKESKKLN